LAESILVASSVKRSHDVTGDEPAVKQACRVTSFEMSVSDAKLSCELEILKAASTIGSAEARKISSPHFKRSTR
jgi:hypothetical protein